MVGNPYLAKVGVVGSNPIARSNIKISPLRSDLPAPHRGAEKMARGLTSSEGPQSIRVTTCSRLAKNLCHPYVAPW